MPPKYFLSSLAVVVVLRVLTPFAVLSSLSLEWIGGVLILGGIGLNVVGAGQFERLGTPIRPGSRSGSLSTTGVFAISRNPMYLGMVLVITGAAVALGSVPALVVPWLFAWVIRTRFIRHEEAMLIAEFGEEYVHYSGRVRRWI